MDIRLIFELSARDTGFEMGAEDETVVTRREYGGSSQGHAGGGLAGRSAKADTEGHTSWSDIYWWGEGVMEMLNIQVDGGTHWRKGLMGGL